MAQLPRVALIVEMSGTYGRQILRGVTRYTKSHRPWSVLLDWQQVQMRTSWFRRAHWDGVICRSADPQLIRFLRRSKVPTVYLSQHSLRGSGLPRIWSDHRATGKIGAKHLIERGFRHFAFCGYTAEAWSILRRDGFVKALAEAGLSCALHESPWAGNQVPDWNVEQARLAQWIVNLPKPLGLMACNDVRGQQVLNSCRSAQVVVPEQVAVLGVDNDEVLCDLCDPPMSSVALNPRQIGYEAAELLDQLMAGVEPEAEERLVSPLDVIVRQSTDVIATDNADIRAAIQFIRENACAGIGVEDVAEHTGLSRSTLERQFRDYLGCSPHAQIRQNQVKRVQQLLSETELTVEAIASLTSFVHPEYLGVAFKRLTGQTPGEYRRAAHMD